MTHKQANPFGAIKRYFSGNPFAPGQTSFDSQPSLGSWAGSALELGSGNANALGAHVKNLGAFGNSAKSDRFQNAHQVRGLAKPTPYIKPPQPPKPPTMNSPATPAKPATLASVGIPKMSFVKEFAKQADNTEAATGGYEGLPTANDIVDMNSAPGLLADYAMGLPFGADRAGRSDAMARSIGMHPTFNQRNPVTANTLWGLGGATAGGLLGSGLGYLADSVIPDQTEGLGSTIGGVAGGYTGAIAGALYNSHQRRKEMAATNEKYDEARAMENHVPEVKPGDAVSPQLPEVSAWNYLGFLGGPHAHGRMRAYRDMTGKSLPHDNLIAGGMNTIIGGAELTALPAARLSSVLQARTMRAAENDPELAKHWRSPTSQHRPEAPPVDRFKLREILAKAGRSA